MAAMSLNSLDQSACISTLLLTLLQLPLLLQPRVRVPADAMAATVGAVATMVAAMKIVMDGLVKMIINLI